MEHMNPLIPMAVVIPLAGGLLSVLVPGKLKRLGDLLALVVTGGLVALSLRFLLLGESGTYMVGARLAPVGIMMVLDGLSVFMLTVISVISFVAVLYSVQYMDRYTARGKYYGLFLLMVTGMNGVVLTGDLFNLYVFLEIASIASYALVAFGCEKDELEASFKYVVLGSVATTVYLLGVAFLYMQVGTVNMADVLSQLSADAPSRGVLLAAVFMMAGLCVKAALIPFHAWLPDAHPSAPAPISAMLSGVLIKAVGIYALGRLIFNVFVFNMNGNLVTPLSEVLIVLGVISMVAGVLLGPVQEDFKRLLAYHSISQMGYIAVGLGLGTELGILAGLFHLVNHAVFKSLLFLSAGAVEMRTGTRDLHKMGGLAKKMPVTAATYFTGAMSIGGVPPFNGFFSKLLIIVACVAAGRYGVAIAAVIVSMITLGCFLKVQKEAFFGEDEGRWSGVKEAPITMALSLVLLAILCLGLSGLVIPGRPKGVLQNARNALFERNAYTKHLDEVAGKGMAGTETPETNALGQER